MRLARLDRLWAPPAVALVLVLGFVGLRLATFDGDASRFVVAGTTFTDAALAPGDLYVLDGGGYDGQFFYRLALDPAELEDEAYGIRLDLGLRRARIGYPAVAWAAAGGQQDAVVWSLIAVNVAAAALLAFLGGLAARDSGRHALWGLLFAAFPGFVFTVARDLSEVLEASALLAGLLLWRRGQHVAAGAALSVAVLTRESSLIVVGALAAVWLVGLARRRAGARSAAAWALPVVAFVAWEAVVYADLGVVPVTGNEANLTAPFAGLVPELSSWLGDVVSKAHVVRLAALGLLVGALVYAAASLRRSRAPAHEKLAWAAFLVFAACLSRFVYVDPGEFRVLGGLWVLSLLIVLGDPSRRLLVPGVATAAVWAAAALYRGFVT